MKFNSLDAWLDWQSTLNPAEIDLGLDRIADVLQRMGLSQQFNCPLIMVAGTNGKGSVVALLEAIATAAGFNVCSYTSPHITRYNERIRINGECIDDDRLCRSFERIDQARGTQPLTYFEFGTLAAIDCFKSAQPDLVIMEIGLGGRLDAVNIMEPDVSVITSIAIDHTDWLGDDREAIVDALYNLAACMLGLRSYDRALVRVHEAKSELQMDNQSISGDILILEATILFRAGKPDEAWRITDQILSAS